MESTVKDLLFLKKKKQKDFSPLARVLIDRHARQEDRSFLVLFFKK